MSKNVLITGASRRIGAACARFLHAVDCNVIVHYNNSELDALRLTADLNGIREDSAISIKADLLQQTELQHLAETALAVWDGVDVLINNASVFYPRPIQLVTEQDWDLTLGSNLKAPFFLSQALLPSLKAKRGCIVNIVDIHAETGLFDYPVYSMSKAGLVAMTRCMAKDMAPQVRVNAVAPGAILWPEQAGVATENQEILKKIALQRCGEVDDIAKAVKFLIDDASYITGQILTVDGGRTLFR